MKEYLRLPHQCVNVLPNGYPLHKEQACSSSERDRNTPFMRKATFPFLSLLLFGLINCAYAQDSATYVVYLKSGSVIKGKIIDHTPGESVKIKTEAGSTFAYEMSEVQKIEKGTNPLVHSAPEKIFIHAHYSRNGISVANGGSRSGKGVGLKFGYAFNQLFTIYVGIDGAKMDREVAPELQSEYGSSTAVGHFDLGSQLNFRAGHALVPYLDASLSGVAESLTFERRRHRYSGFGVTIGGGVKYFLSRKFAVDGGISIALARFRQVQSVEQTRASNAGVATSRLNLGITWYPLIKSKIVDN